MADTILVTGGARSGKSRFAESLLAGRNDVLYIATARACDPEMEERIARHRRARNRSWTTIEAFCGLQRELAPFAESGRPVLLDCLTIMISSLLVEPPCPDWDNLTPAQAAHLEQRTGEEVDALLDALRKLGGKTVIVTNEVGMGLVPDNPLGRLFRDIAGRLNQKMAQAADDVYLLVSGIPVKIKG